MINRFLEKIFGRARKVIYYTAQGSQDGVRQVRCELMYSGNVVHAKK